mgnify:CR=1 FL=1
MPNCLEVLMQFFRLCACFADHHAAQTVISLNFAKAYEVGDDISQEFVNIVIVFDDLMFADVLLLHQRFQLLLYCGEFFSVGRFDVLTYDLERIAVGDGTVVIVGMQIVAEYLARSPLVFEKWCACECYLDGILIRIEEVGQETAPGTIAAVRFV